MEYREHSSGNDKYEPGSLLPNSKPYEGPHFDARDYLLDEYYTLAKGINFSNSSWS